MWIETALFIAYLFLGPLLWVVFYVGMGTSRRSTSMFKKPIGPLPQPPPSVTILIPAKDEAARIRDCLASALAQNYPQFDVLAVDDRSTDATGSVMAEMAAADPRLRVVSIHDLPPGWTGKTHALHVAVPQATGQWLLFVDSDVILQPSALSSALALAELKRFDMLSLILKLETRTTWESMLIPLASVTFGSTFFMGLSNSRWNNFAFGNGQFMLFRRPIYDAIGGHEAVKSHYNEDMQLARIMKHSGLRPRVAWGTHLGAVRMYDSLPKIMRGWSRIFFGSSNGAPLPILIALFFLLFSCYSFLPAAAWGLYRHSHPLGLLDGRNWLLAAAVHWLLMTRLIAVMYAWTGNRKRYALAFFACAAFVVFILLQALWLCLGGRLEWRGTRYSRTINQPAPTKTGP